MGLPARRCRTAARSGDEVCAPSIWRRLLGTVHGSASPSYGECSRGFAPLSSIQLDRRASQASGTKQRDGSSSVTNVDGCPVGASAAPPRGGICVLDIVNSRGCSRAWKSSPQSASPLSSMVAKRCAWNKSQPASVHRPCSAMRWKSAAKKAATAASRGAKRAGSTARRVRRELGGRRTERRASRLESNAAATPTVGSSSAKSRTNCWRIFETQSDRAGFRLRPSAVWRGLSKVGLPVRCPPSAR